jgi:hypothetical protein
MPAFLGWLQARPLNTIPIQNGESTSAMTVTDWDYLESAHLFHASEDRDATPLGATRRAGPQGAQQPSSQLLRCRAEEYFVDVHIFRLAHRERHHARKTLGRNGPRRSP